MKKDTVENVKTIHDILITDADSSSKCNFRINAEEYLIRRFKGETFSWSVV
jgi:hypothetical protein